MSFELTKTEKDQGTIQALKPRVESLVNAARVIAVREVREAEAATNVLGQIQGRRKKDEELRKSLVKPLQDHVRFINDGFRPLSDALVEAEGIVKSKLLDWNRAEDARVEKLRREAKEKLDRETEAKAEAVGVRTVVEALEAGFTEKEAGELADMEAEAVTEAAPTFVPEAIASSPAKTLSTGFARATVRKTWTFEVTNPDAVPRRLLVVDEKAIRAEVRGGIRNIAGVRIYQEEGISGGR